MDDSQVKLLPPGPSRHQVQTHARRHPVAIKGWDGPFGLWIRRGFSEVPTILAINGNMTWADHSIWEAIPTFTNEEINFGIPSGYYTPITANYEPTKIEEEEKNLPAGLPPKLQMFLKMAMEEGISVDWVSSRYAGTNVCLNGRSHVCLKPNQTVISVALKGGTVLPLHHELEHWGFKFSGIDFLWVGCVKELSHE